MHLFSKGGTLMSDMKIAQPEYFFWDFILGRRIVQTTPATSRLPSAFQSNAHSILLCIVRRINLPGRALLGPAAIYD